MAQNDVPAQDTALAETCNECGVSVELIEKLVQIERRYYLKQRPVGIFQEIGSALEELTDAGTTEGS